MAYASAIRLDEKSLRGLYYGLIFAKRIFDPLAVNRCGFTYSDYWGRILLCLENVIIIFEKMSIILPLNSFAVLPFKLNLAGVKCLMLSLFRII